MGWFLNTVSALIALIVLAVIFPDFGVLLVLILVWTVSALFQFWWIFIPGLPVWLIWFLILGNASDHHHHDY